MKHRAGRHGLSLRPHFKTHQSGETGRLFREEGISRITVSSLDMAIRFAADGWKDMLVAFPFDPATLQDVNSFPGDLRLSILLDNTGALRGLEGLKKLVDFYIDIDTGYGRTGIEARRTGLVRELLDAAGKNPALRFRGFYCHAGHSYKAGGRDERDRIHNRAMEDLAGLKVEFAELSPLVLYGDTPNCSIQEAFGPVDELTPGNFVYYDLMQYSLGSCGLDEIAVKVECQVAGIYPERKQLVVHGGAVHFSKERMVVDGQDIFGRLVPGPGQEDMAPVYLRSLSQEHGILEGCPRELMSLDIGDLLQFWPVHSCLTANLMKEHTSFI